jgi:hypothetical protein
VAGVCPTCTVRDAASAVSGAVVVGYDGSPASRVAVDEAADEAARRGRPLAVVTVSAGSAPSGAVVDLAHPSTGPRTGAEDALAQVAQRVRDAVPGLEVSAHALRGEAVSVLRRLSERAATVVLGATGWGLASPGTGAVVRTLPLRAACSLLVVRERARAAASGRAVVAAVEAADEASAVLDVSAAAAARRCAELRLVQVYSGATRGAAGEAARRLPRTASAARLLTDDGPPTVTGQVCVARADDRALLTAAEGAELLVLAVHPEPGAGGPRIDATTRAALGSASAGVLLVPPRLPGLGGRSAVGYRDALERELAAHPDRPDGCRSPEELDDAWRVGVASPAVGDDVVRAWRALAEARTSGREPVRC